MKGILKGFVEALRIPDRRSTWQWCEDHLIVDETSPIPGRWRSSNSPWVKPPMEDVSNPDVEYIVVKCSAQSAKTQTIIGCACWVIGEDPGPAMWVTAARDEATDFLKDRVLPTFRACRPVKAVLREVKGLTCRFAGMPFYFTGAGSPSKLQSKPIRWLFLDEVRNYPDGALELALNRTTAFWNAKVFLISTPGKVSDDVEQHFRMGSQDTWNIKCPRCQTWQPLLFDRLKWDENDRTRPDGVWHMDNVAETIRLSCVSCDHIWRDTPIERRILARDGKFVSMNPNAPKNRRSYTWNKLLPPWVKWRKIVEQYLNSIQAARADPPDLEPLMSFYCETLGLSWEESLGVIDDFDFLEDRKEDYQLGDVWPDELTRFLSADRQEKGGEHYYWVCRAFSRGGRSRLIGYGRAETTEQLEAIREQYAVPLKNCIIDSGYKATSVYRWCMSSQWKPFKGDQVDLYTVTVIDERTKKAKTVRRIWHKVKVSPDFGKRKTTQELPLYKFSSETTKDLLGEHLRGLVGEWTIPETVGNDYLRQMTAESRVQNKDARGKISYAWVKRRDDNHFWDCEQMILIAAIISKLVQGGTVRTSPEVVKLTNPDKVDG